MQKPTIYITGIFLIIISIVTLGFDSSNKTVPYERDLKSHNIDPAVTVEMTNTMKFTPDTVRIESGQTIKWENTSLLAHSVTGNPSKASIEGSARLPKEAKPFDSGMMDPKQTFSHTFKVSGTYKYFCIPHEGAKMYGWVIVSGK